MEVMEWSNEKYLDLINDYRKSEVLWDVRNPNYKNNRIKRDVIISLAQKYNIDEKSIKNKIKNLRSAFHREHSRLTNKKSGSGSTKDNKKWFAYESLSFILDVTEPRPGTASIINVTNSEENVDIDQHSFMSTRGNLSQNIETDMRPPSTPSTSTNIQPLSISSSMSQDGINGDHARKKKKKSLNTVPQTEHERRAEVAYDILKNSTKRDDCSTYGEYVGNELRKLSSKSQIYAKHMINNVLFKAALGLYDNQQVTHEASISSIQTTVLTPDIDLNTNNQSPYDNQYTMLVCEPSLGELDTQHEQIDRSRNDESQSGLVEYLDPTIFN